LEDAEEMSEERRLFYVGLTRAKDRLFLLHAFRRTSWGQTDAKEPSRFLDEMPAELIDGRKPRKAKKTVDWSWNSSSPTRASSAGSRGTSASYPSVRSDRYRSTPSQSSSGQSWQSQPKPKPLPKRQNPFKKEIKEGKYKAGQRVRHAKFGDGIVVESRVRRDREEVTVAFGDKNAGIKTLDTSIAKLEIRK
jgi:DNA helicase-2/ATP-dependent DNA helicase PcrA